MALIKSKIVITTGMVWPVSSDKWKAALNGHLVSFTKVSA